MWPEHHGCPATLFVEDPCANKTVGYSTHLGKISWLRRNRCCVCRNADASFETHDERVPSRTSRDHHRCGASRPGMHSGQVFWRAARPNAREEGEDGISIHDLSGRGLEDAADREKREAERHAAVKAELETGGRVPLRNEMSTRTRRRGSARSARSTTRSATRAPSVQLPAPACARQAVARAHGWLENAAFAAAQCGRRRSARRRRGRRSDDLGKRTSPGRRRRRTTSSRLKRGARTRT